jgi:CubicO group peptidase (beta-lactamase class C family)
VNDETMPSDRRVSGVTGVLMNAVQRDEIPGAVAVWSAGPSEIPTTAVQVGSTAKGPVGRATSTRIWYDLASLTKPLVVTSLFLIARRAGLVDTSTTVGEVLPELAGSALQQATMLDLLTHRSPLPAWVPLYALADGNPDRSVECLARLEPRPRPPEVVYSCPGFVLLGKVLERLLRAPLDRLFVRYVLEPIGLEGDLAFCPHQEPSMIAPGALSAKLERRMTSDLGGDPESVPVMRHGLPDDGNARFLGGVAGNAGLFGTADGVHALARHYIAGDRAFFSKEEITTATRNYTQGLEQHRGLGWQVATSPECSAGTSISETGFGHVGHTGTSVWIDPKRRSVVVLLTNRHHPEHSDHDLHPLRRRLNDVIFG